MTKDEVFQLIIRHTCEIIPELIGHDFKKDDRLLDLGANSVDRAEIIAMTMESLALQIPRVELFGAKNLEELAEILYEKSQHV